MCVGCLMKAEKKIHHKVRKDDPTKGWEDKITGKKLKDTTQVNTKKN